MKTYTAKTPIDYGTKEKPARRYEIGETIEVEDSDAEALIAIKAIEPHDPKAAFKDAVRKAESAGRELEKAGIDPSEAANELRVQEREALDQAVAASAVLIGAGALSVADAADQICAQIASAKHDLVVSRLEEEVEKIKRAPAATDTSAAPANTASAQPKAEAKDKKKR